MMEDNSDIENNNQDSNNQDIEINDENEETSCSICIEHLDETTKILTCSHQFHEKCINEWLEENSTCPLCRDEIPGLVRTNIADITDISNIPENNLTESLLVPTGAFRRRSNRYYRKKLLYGFLSFICLGLIIIVLLSLKGLNDDCYLSNCNLPNENDCNICSVIVENKSGIYEKNCLWSKANNTDDMSKYCNNGNTESLCWEPYTCETVCNLCCTKDYCLKNNCKWVKDNVLGGYICRS